MSKIRKSFVSNSSSSSFIVLGIELDGEFDVIEFTKKVCEVTEEKIKEWDEYISDDDIGEARYEAKNVLESQLDLIFYSDTDASDNDILGIHIASGIEESGGGSVDISELTEKLKEIQKKTGLKGKIKLFYGNEAC